MATVTFDDAQWTRKLAELGDEAGRAGVEAVGKAALQLLNDAVMQEPTVPIDEGTLRASGSVHVNGDLEATSPYGEGGTPNEGVDETSSNYGEHRGVLRSTVGFNTPYAAVLHEGEGLNFTEPGSGAKYLSSKVDSNADDYRKIMAAVIKSNMKRAV